MSESSQVLRVGLIGYGAIGSALASEIEKRGGLELAGVYAKSPVPDRIRAGSVVELTSRADIIVEAASQEAVGEYGPGIVDKADLFVVSVGALRDDDLAARLKAGQGRLLVTTGAIGGVDQLRAAALMGELDQVALTTTKSANALIQPWMEVDEADALRNAQEPIVAFEGSAREAAKLFPASLNVAATLALTTVGFDRVSVRLIGDPRAERVEHIIHARGVAGEYEFRIINSPSSERTSAITPYAVLRGLLDLESHVVIGF